MTFGSSGRALIPDELVDAYGADVLLPEGTLIRASKPLSGHFVRSGSYPTPGVGNLTVGSPEFVFEQRRALVWQAAYEAVINGIGRAVGPHIPNPAFLFQWRAQGSGDPWTQIPGEFLGITVFSEASLTTEGARIVRELVVEDHRLNPLDPLYDAAAPDLPTTDQIIEFYLFGSIPPDKLHPIIIEGISTGEFVVNVYEGIYSARDSNGDVVPSGIRYDQTAILARMTDLVRIRLDGPIENAREWLETHIYAPTGWCPALDALGRISPVSQVPPDDLAIPGLPLIDDAIAEPSADWDAGQRIINSVRVKYFRDYSVGPPDPPLFLIGQARQNLLQEQEVILEAQDPVSIERNGLQEIELDGSAFRAIGVQITTLQEQLQQPVNRFGFSIPFNFKHPRPVTSQPIILSQTVGPVSGDIADELGWQLFQLRQTYLLNRYSLGAPSIRLTIMRQNSQPLLVGDWVRLNLSWVPDYLTGRRGLVGLGQIVALGDLDCAWRQVLVEIVVPPVES